MQGHFRARVNIFIFCSMFKIEGLNLPSEVKKDPDAPKTKKGGKAVTPQPQSLARLVSQLEDADRKPKNKKRKLKQKEAKTIDTNSLPDVTAKQISSDPELPAAPKSIDHESKRVSKPAAEAPQRGGTAPSADSVVGGSKRKVTLTPLQQKMQQKLSGARFRWINELLYTSESQKALSVFQSQPEVFNEYHEGFRHQVESWPENPVDSFVEQFELRLQKNLNAPGGLPATKHLNQIVVADMGCGEAELALKLGQIKHKKARFEVHSFDLHAANDRITVADIAHVPLPDSSCHVVVFCLALMGTNLNDFIKEGIRILKDNGLVWIAEIKSRFEGGNYDEFIKQLKSVGLYHKTTDDTNKMFVKFEFLKLPHRMAKAKALDADIHLKPCIYKRR